MNRLTEDMTRLCSEIRSLRASRQMLRTALAEGNRERQMEAVELCADFANTLARRAERARANRQACLHSLKQTVASQARDIRASLAVVRRIWFGRAV